jgi:hypothetical protein
MTSDFDAVFENRELLEHVMLFLPTNADLGRIVQEYQKFMTCRRDTPLFVAFQPSQFIDECWHAHILFTKDEHAFYKNVFGHYLHHKPRDGTEGFGFNDYANTLEASLKRFALKFHVCCCRSRM